MAAVKKDMESDQPMDRLVCGDVGFGKTEVAIRAAFKAAVDGKQVAVLVPTTILALQHYRSFSERLRNFPVRVEYLNRTKTAKEVSQIRAGSRSSPNRTSSRRRSSATPSKRNSRAADRSTSSTTASRT